MTQWKEYKHYEDETEWEGIVSGIGWEDVRSVGEAELVTNVSEWVEGVKDVVQVLMKGEEESAEDDYEKMTELVEY